MSLYEFRCSTHVASIYAYYPNSEISYNNISLLPIVRLGVVIAAGLLFEYGLQGERVMLGQA